MIFQSLKRLKVLKHWWTLTFIVNNYYINNCCHLVAKISNSIIKNKWFWHFGNICTFSHSFSRIFFSFSCLWAVRQYGILIFSRNIHKGAKSFIVSGILFDFIFLKTDQIKKAQMSTMLGPNFSNLFDLSLHWGSV